MPRWSSACHTVRVVAHGELPAMPGVIETARKGNLHTLLLPSDMTSQALLRHLADTPELNLESFELAIPQMDDIFVKVVGGG